ncbi:hypothetical protein [Saccharothrix hoggarensis]|uniref:hypothetical protein n=1 Tax=Saccharothrix hoggarensis TaxID=913853 RepID=UPI0036D238CC
MMPAMSRQMIHDRTETHVKALPGMRVWHNAGCTSWIDVHDDGGFTVGHAADWRIFTTPIPSEPGPSRDRTLRVEFTG